MEETMKKQLDDLFYQIVKKKNKGGVSLILFNDEEVFYEVHDGFIQKENNIRPDENSLYMIGSNTKVFTALGILKLYEEGKLSLDDDVRDYLPLKVKSRFGDQKITIESLLMHRSGLQCDLYEYFITESKDFSDVIEGLNKTYLTSIPGEMFSYSNLGFTLLGLIIQKVSGMTYVDYLKKILLHPMEIEMYFGREDELPKEVSDHLAYSYDKKGNRTKDALGCMIPAGSCTYTRIKDLAKIGMLLMNKGVYQGKRYFKEETIEMMTENKVMDSADEEVFNYSYGIIHNQLDLKHRTSRIIGHGGNTLYHHSCFNYLPEEKVGIIVFTNSKSGIQLSRKAEKEIFDKYFELMDHPLKEEVKFTELDPNQYFGKYDTLMGPIEFKTSGNQLMTMLPGFKIRLKKDENDYLHCEATGLWGLIPPLANKIREISFKQCRYLGKDVLIMKQGVALIAGKRYEETKIDPEWKKATGTYVPKDPRMNAIAKKAILTIKNKELLLTLRLEEQPLNYFLTCINGNEAIVKGFGRNTNQTVYLYKENDKYCISVDGIEMIRK